MEQTSRLSVVVDTRNAETQLRSFNASLRASERSGERFSSIIAKMTAGSDFGKFNQSILVSNSHIQNLSQNVTNASNAVKLLGAALKELKGAGSISIKTDEVRNLSRANQQGATAAQQAAFMQDKLTASAAKAASAQSNAAKAATNAQSAQNRLSASTTNAAAANARLTASEFAAETAMNKTIASTFRAEQAQNQLAASAVRLGATTQNAANNAVLAQDRLAASRSRVAASASQSAAAESRAAGASSNAAAAASRANAAVSGEAAARDRASAAASRAAAAASNAAGAQDRAAVAALRLAAAEARAAADADRLAGGLGRVNGQGRGLMGTLNGLQGILSGGLFAITGISVLKTADQMQNLNSQIRIVTSSEEELLAVRTRIRDIADKNFNDVAATTDLYQKSARALANLGKSQADAVMFTDAVSLAMRTGGRSAQEQASAILQLGQAMGAGALMGDEFRSISENAPILLELVSKRMGVLPGQLKELASEGKITSEIMYDAFSQNIDLLEEMATKIPLTMGQALTVAKNQYKKYVDGIMNDTGGASSVIAGFITDIGNNFDTIVKVGVAGLGFAFANLALSIGSASTAMAIFNAVAGLNPLILVAGGFLAVTSSIYGTNEVLTLTGTMIADLIGELGDMANFLGNTWDDVSDWIMENVFQIEKAISDSNDKNRKSYFGFYEETEKGFAGLVQRIMGNVASVGALTGTMITYYQQFVDNLVMSVTNLMTAFENLYKMGKNLFGGNETLGEFRNYNALDVIQIYRDQNSQNQDVVANYVRGANQRAGIAPTPLDKQWSNPLTRGFSFSNALTPGTNSVLRNQPAGLPEWLKPDASSQPLSTSPIDLVKKAQYDQLKAQQAITAATEEREKLAKAQAKAANSSELVRKAVLGGKDWGLSNGGSFGGSRGHNGIDIPTPKGTQVYAPEGGTIKAYGSNASRGGKQMILVADSGKKYGFAHLDSFDVSNGTRVPAGMGIAKTGNSGTRPNGKGYANHLHLTVTDINGKKVDPTKLKVGKTAYDNTIGKANTAAQREATTAAAKAERERIQAAEIALREQERIEALRLKLVKEYGDKDLQLKIDHDLRVAEIREAGFNSTKTDELIKQSEQQMSRELAVYENGLQEKVSALDNYQQTEAAMLARERDSKRFELKNDIELSRAENSELLQLALDSVDAEYEYKLERYELALSQEKNSLIAFKQTERQIWQADWDAKIAQAVRANDELANIRLQMLLEQKEQEDTLMKLTQSDKMLELRKSHMTEMDYIKAKYDLESQLINTSNEPQEIKDLQIDALKQPSRDDLKGVMSDIKQEDPFLALQAEYDRRMEIVRTNEMLETGIIGSAVEERIAIEQSYMDAKRDLMLDQGEAIFGNLASLSKTFLGDQSAMYRSLFAIEKGYTLAKVLLKNKEAIAEAWASAPFPYNIPAVATTVAGTAGLASAVSGIMPGFKQGGYTGNMGASQVAGVVHGQEYVFDAQSTKRIGVDNLNAMRSGKASSSGETKVIVNNYSNEKANVQTTPDGDTIVTIGKMVNQMVDGKLSQWERNAKRQGHALYGMR